MGNPESPAPSDRISREVVALGLLAMLPRAAAVLVFDPALRFVSVHGDALRRAGWADEAILGRTAPDALAGTSDGDALLAAYHGALRGERSELRLVSQMRAWQVEVGPLRDGADQIVGGLVVGQDITPTQQARRLHEARTRAAEIIATARDELPRRLVNEVAPLLQCLAAVYWQATPDDRLEVTASWVSDPAADGLAALELETRRRTVGRGDGLVGLAYATGRWQVVADLRGAEPAPWVDMALGAGARAVSAVPAISGGRPVGVFEFFAPVPVEDDPDVAAALTAIVNDVANAWERRRQLESLQALADHDGLTGLLNRRRFEEELRRQAAAGSRYGRLAAVLALDLDDFKAVNDRHGHAAGDDLLREVAAMLRRRLRPSDRAARLGGDEFGVILDAADPAAARRVAAQLAADVAGLRLTRAPDVRPSVSVGVAPLADDGLSALHEADQAMYARKRRTG